MEFIQILFLIVICVAIGFIIMKYNVISNIQNPLKRNEMTRSGNKLRILNYGPYKPQKYEKDLAELSI